MRIMPAAPRGGVRHITELLGGDVAIALANAERVHQIVAGHDHEIGHDLDHAVAFQHDIEWIDVSVLNAVVLKVSEHLQYRP